MKRPGRTHRALRARMARPLVAVVRPRRDERRRERPQSRPGGDRTEDRLLIDGQDAGLAVAWSVAEGWVRGFWPSYAAMDGIPTMRRTGVVSVTGAVPPERPYTAEMQARDAAAEADMQAWRDRMAANSDTPGGARSITADSSRARRV